MAKRGWRPPTCRICGRGRAQGIYVSQRGKCRDCALAREEENIIAMQEREGRMFDYWRLRSSARLEAVPVELIPQYLDRQERRRLASETHG